MTEKEMLGRVLKAVRASIEHEEGVRYVTYKDSLGKLTGGIGHLILSKDGFTRAGQTIPKKTVEKWYISDATKAIKAAIKQAIEVGEYEEDFIIALTHVNFQLGVYWPQKWPNTYAKLKAGDLKAVIRAFQGSLWNRQTPRRVANIIVALEQEIKENNQFKHAPIPSVKPTVTTVIKEKDYGIFSKYIRRIFKRWWKTT